MVEPFPFLALSHKDVSDVTWGPVLSLTLDGSTRLHHGNRALYQVVCDLSGHFTDLVIYCHLITILKPLQTALLRYALAPRSRIRLDDAKSTPHSKTVCPDF